MASPKTSAEPGTGLLGVLRTRYGLAGATLEGIGAFVVMWASFSNAHYGA